MKFPQYRNQLLLSPAVLPSYRPTSDLCVLAKAPEALVREQFKEFVHTNAVLSKYQSGFRENSHITAAVKV